MSAASQSFRPQQKVYCVDNTNHENRLVIGKQYVIARIPSPDMIVLEGMTFKFKSFRFSATPPGHAEKSNEKVSDTACPSTVDEIWKAVTEIGGRAAS